MPILTCLNKGRIKCGEKFNRIKLLPGDTLEIAEDDIPFFRKVIDRGYASLTDPKVNADGGAANSGTATMAPANPAHSKEKKNKKRKKYRKRKNK